MTYWLHKDSAAAQDLISLDDVDPQSDDAGRAEERWRPKQLSSGTGSRPQIKVRVEFYRFWERLSGSGWPGSRAAYCSPMDIEH